MTISSVLYWLKRFNKNHSLLYRGSFSPTLFDLMSGCQMVHPANDGKSFAQKLKQSDWVAISCCSHPASTMARPKREIYPRAQSEGIIRNFIISPRPNPFNAEQKLVITCIWFGFGSESLFTSDFASSNS